MAAIYLRHLIPGLFAYAFLQCILRFLQTQTVVIPLVVCSAVPLALHVGITFVIVYCTTLGFKGAALSAALSLWISVIMLGLYVNYSDKFKYTWEGLSTESFKHVLPSMKLAIPSAVMVCLEYWAFEILVLLAGLMPNSENSTSLIAMCVNTEGISYMITYGFSAAV
ncbi:Detoxification-like protein, partial [Thalictrum thalictroides]